MNAFVALLAAAAAILLGLVALELLDALSALFAFAIVFAISDFHERRNGRGSVLTGRGGAS